MPSQGPQSPTAAAEDTTVGTEVWNDPTFVFSSNNIRAVSGGLSVGEISRYLTASGFGFTIPSRATIDGIECTCERQADFANDNSVKILKAGVVTGSEKSTGATWVAGTDTVATFGSSTDLWGTTWTPADINNSGFGFAVSAIGIAGGPAAARIDHMTVTVYYTLLFPATSVLDDFNRANTTNDLGANWTGPLQDGLPVGSILSNQLVGGDTAAYWSAATFGANQEVYATIAALPVDYFQLWARVSNPGSIPNGYTVNIYSTGVMDAKWFSGGSSDYVSLSSAVHTYVPGDAVGLEVNGSTVTIYYKPAAGAWTVNATGTDSNVTSGGWIGYHIGGFETTTTKLDNFGGGTIVTAEKQSFYVTRQRSISR